eukprot:403337229
MNKSSFILIMLLGLLQQYSALFESTSMILRYELNYRNISIINPRTLQDIVVDDQVYSVVEISEKNSRYNMTQVIEIVKITDPKVKQLNTLTFSFDSYTNTTYTENQCLLVQRRGKDVVTNERADKLKEGDFLLAQLNEKSNAAKLIKITKIVKSKTDSSRMMGIKTQSSYFIASIILVSDKENNCGTLSYKPTLMSEQEEQVVDISQFMSSQVQEENNKLSLKQKVREFLSKVKKLIQLI